MGSNQRAERRAPGGQAPWPAPVCCLAGGRRGSGVKGGPEAVAQRSRSDPPVTHVKMRVATFVDSSVDARLATAVVGGLWPGAFLLVVTVRSWLVRAWISR